VDFQYDTPDGDTELSRTYRVPVTVENGDDGGGNGLLGALAGLLGRLFGALSVAASGSPFWLAGGAGLALAGVVLGGRRR
jgi:hypothetical protein